jgi:AcrR family transcriptional regulator
MSTRFSGRQVHPRHRRLEPRKRPVQARSRETIGHILTAATQVFEKHGYAAGTTNRIAAHAGVSIGTLYQYFPSKEAVAVALLERHLEETVRKLREWVGHMVSEHHGLDGALRDYVKDMLEMHSGQPRLQHILLEETPLPHRVHESLLTAEREMAKTMAGLLRTYPTVAHPSLERAGTFVVQTVEALTHRYAAHPDHQGMSREEFADELVVMLKAYLSPS